MTLWDFLDLSPLQSWFNFWFLIIFVLPGDRDWDDSEATRGEGIVSSLGIITADKLPIIKYLQLQIARERNQIRFFWNRSQLEEAEQRQRELQTTRLALEKEITVKKNSISIDRSPASKLPSSMWALSKQLLSPPPFSTGHFRTHFSQKPSGQVFRPSESKEMAVKEVCLKPFGQEFITPPLCGQRPHERIAFYKVAFEAR